MKQEKTIFTNYEVQVSCDSTDGKDGAWATLDHVIDDGLKIPKLRRSGNKMRWTDFVFITNDSNNVTNPTMNDLIWWRILYKQQSESSGTFGATVFTGFVTSNTYSHGGYNAVTVVPHGGRGIGSPRDEVVDIP